MRLVPLALAAGLLLTVADAHAQATRTWVSGVGDDANPCSRTAPCKTWAGAISKTAAGGEIDALDPGGYGAVTITKSITLNGSGLIASATTAGTNGIVINGAGVRVTLRAIELIGAGTGVDGVRVLDASMVTVEQLTIHEYTGHGITITAPGVTVLVRDTSIHDVATNGTSAGINVAPSSASARVVLDDVDVHGAANGIAVAAGGQVVIRHSNVSANGLTGILATGAGVDVDVADVTAAMNGVGISADAGAVVRTTRVLVAGNTTSGMVATNGGAVLPFVENQVTANPPAGAPATCDLPDAVVGCPPVPTSCPDVNVPACPDVPACPNVEVPACPTATATLVTHLGPCKKCKTRGGTTTCTSCAVAAQ